MTDEHQEQQDRIEARRAHAIEVAGELGPANITELLANAKLVEDYLNPAANAAASVN